MASTPFWFVAQGDGQGGTNSTIPISTPVATSPAIPTGSDAASNGASTIDLSSFFNSFGFTPGNTPSNPYGSGVSNPGGLFASLQQWTAQNPGMALLLGVLLFVMVGNVASGKGK